MKISSGLQLLLTLSVAAILTACSGAQTTAPRGPDVGVAQDLAARGDHTGASRAYLDLAVAATGDQRQRYYEDKMKSYPPNPEGSRPSGGYRV